MTGNHGMTGATGGDRHDTTATGHHSSEHYGEGHGTGLGMGNTHGGHRGVGAETYGGAPGVAPGHTDYPQGGTGRAAEHSSSGGGGKSLEGKIEKGLGTMIGSDSLKQKGLEKEREAAILKEQAQHLEHAERLELEAKMHREAALGSHHAGGVRPAGENSTVPGEQLTNAPGQSYGGNHILPGGGAIGRTL
jgi:hypothetical protein